MIDDSNLVTHLTEKYAYDPARRYENSAGYEPATKRQKKYIKYLAEQFPIEANELKIVVFSHNKLIEWNQITKSDAMFIIGKLSKMLGIKKERIFDDDSGWKTKHKIYDKNDLLIEGKRAIAGRRVNQALNNGILSKGDYCQICLESCETVGHHFKGYDFPFDVWWVCRRCNANLRPHDGSLTLDEARDLILNKYANKSMALAISEAKDNSPSRYRTIVPCQVCGIPGKITEMSVTEDLEYAMILCQYCASKLGLRLNY